MELPLLRYVVGDILRGLRREQRRTLADVSAAARVSIAYLSEVERGRKEASSEVLAAICRALGITVLDLVARAHSELEAVQTVRTLTTLQDARATFPTAPAGPGGPGGAQVSLLAA